MPETLVLNASYEPLGVVSQRRAVVLLVSGKAECLEAEDTMVRSARMSVPSPAVLRLVRLVKVPYRASVPMTRRGVLARDGHRCAYCGSPATSLDHVIPRSRGGTHTWDNVVAACGGCNHRKADRTVAELGWRLRTVPCAPTGATWRILGSRRVPVRWRHYLGYEADIGEATA